MRSPVLQHLIRLLGFPTASILRNCCCSSGQACLFAIDLDKFKDVNDAFGHSAGDQLLITLSHRISAILKKPCELIRVGGDEFIIQAPDFSVEEGIALASYISQLLREYDLPAGVIEIELTENETCINIDHINSALSDISDIGIEIAIDDFGTGMSSLAYLDNLKTKTNRGHQAIVASALTLADTFECKVLAEGVETQSQVDTLLTLGCFYAQGYFFAKPMSEEDIKHYIKTTCVQPVWGRLPINRAECWQAKTHAILRRRRPRKNRQWVCSDKLHESTGSWLYGIFVANTHFKFIATV